MNVEEAISLRKADPERELLFILGTQDPEMQKIEEVIKSTKKYIVAYAHTQQGRVRPETAYKATSIQGDGFWNVDSSVIPVTVECGGMGDMPRISVKIDHHNEGDYGFGRKPQDYWQASSIGQVCMLLGIEATQELRFVAAADHCLGAAYKWLCPGVDPEDLLKWRLEGRAKFQKRSVEELLVDFDKALTAIREADCFKDGVVDLCDKEVPELPDAAAYTGKTVLAGPFRCPDGRYKYNLLSCTPEQGRKFLNKEYIDLNEVYGDPMRGIVGGYVDLTTPGSRYYAIVKLQGDNDCALVTGVRQLSLESTIQEIANSDIVNREDIVKRYRYPQWQLTKPERPQNDVFIGLYRVAADGTSEWIRDIIH